MMYGDYYFPGEELDQMAEGGIPSRYKNMGFSKVGQKKKSTRPGKKWMVLAKKGDQYKVVHGGDSKMKDFSQHGSEKRKDRFWDRMGGRDSAKAKDPFSPLYWHKKFGTWQKGGEANPVDVIRSMVVPAGAPRGEFNIVPPFEDDPNLRSYMFNFPQDYAGWRTFAENAKNSPGYFLTGRGTGIPEGRSSSDYVNQQLKYSAGKTFPSVRLNGWGNGGEPQNEGFQALPEAVQAKIMANMMYGGDMYGMGGMPCYECGGTKMKEGGTPFIAMAYFRDGGIELDPAKKGTFKAMATRMGLSVQEAAKKILDAPEGKYSPEMRRKANFARNFAKEYGGMPEYQFAGSTEEPFFELQTPITGLQPKGFDMRMFDSLEETKKRMENPSSLIQPASPIKPIEPKRGFSLANQAAYVTGLRMLEAMTRDNSAEKRYNASQTLADSYGPVQRMNPFDWYGEYVTNQGDLLNPRQMAPVQFRGMDYPMYMEEGGQVVELDDKQIKQLLALGAEIEMLDQ